MTQKNKSRMRHLTAAISALFIFISTFADCFHSHHLEGSIADKSSSTMGKQVAENIVAAEEHEDCDGYCPACSYLLVAQGAYFDSVSLPGKQAPDQYYVGELKFFHNNLFIENLPRAPPYFTV
jgi:hypothetical protein